MRQQCTPRSSSWWIFSPRAMSPGDVFIKASGPGVTRLQIELHFSHVTVVVIPGRIRESQHHSPHLTGKPMLREVNDGRRGPGNQAPRLSEPIQGTAMET